MKAGVVCDDGVAAYYIDGKLCEYVSSREHALAYSVAYINESVIEKKITPRYLG